MATKIKLKQIEGGTSGQLIEVNGSGTPIYVDKNTILLSSFNNDLPSSTQTLQQVLTTGATLTQNNTIDLATFDLGFNNGNVSFGTSITTPLIKGVGGFIQTFSTDLVNIGNAVTTNQRMVRIGQDTAFWDIGSGSSATSAATIYGNVTPGSTNYFLQATSGGTNIINGGNGTLLLRGADFTLATFNGGNFDSGANVNITFSPSTSTNQTATANISNFVVNGSTKTWQTGTVASQYFNFFKSNTVNAASASTFTLVGNNVFEYPQGTATTGAITTSAAIYVPTLALTNTTTSYGIYAQVSTGATTNWGIGTNGRIQGSQFHATGFTDRLISGSDGTGLISTQFLANGGLAIAAPSNLRGIGFFRGGTTGTELWRMTDVNGNLTNTVAAGTAYIHLKAGTVSEAQLRLETSVAPTTPNNGDIWFDGTDLKIRVSGVTYTITKS